MLLKIWQKLFDIGNYNWIFANRKTTLLHTLSWTWWVHRPGIELQGAAVPYSRLHHNHVVQSGKLHLGKTVIVYNPENGLCPVFHELLGVEKRILLILFLFLKEKTRNLRKEDFKVLFRIQLSILEILKNKQRCLELMSIYVYYRMLE